MKKIVFLGCGYLGYNCATLLSKQYDVKLWGLTSPYSFSPLFEEVDAFNLTNIQQQSLKDAIVIDTMSLFPFNLEVEDEQTFLNDFLNKYQGLYEELKKCKIAQYIYLSSGGTVYGNCALPCSEDYPLHGIDLNLYSKSKILLEKVIQESLDKYTILRLSNPYGGYQLTNRRQGVIPVLIESALYQKEFHCWNTLDSLRDYIYIDDLANALSLVIENYTKNQIYNIGSGHSTSLKQIIETVESYCQNKVVLIQQAVDPHVVSDSLLNIDKFVKETGFKASISLDEGIEKEVMRIKGENK